MSRGMVTQGFGEIPCSTPGLYFDVQATDGALETYEVSGVGVADKLLEP